MPDKVTADVRYEADHLWNLGVPKEEYGTYVEDVRDWLREEVDREYYTPDLHILNRHYEHDVFVYGATKKNMKRSWIIGQEPTAIGVGYTVSDKFVMYREDSSQPDAIAFPCGDVKISGALYGEIYRVPVKGIVNLDFFYNNGGLYKRLKQTIRVKRGDNYMLHTCWVYIGMKSFWGSRIDNPTTERKLLLCDPLSVTIGDRPVIYYNYQHKYEKNH